jgi:ATP-binding cassette, subfamily B, bacterial
MRKLHFANYRKVYGLIWYTYGKNWKVRLSFLLALVSRTAKFVVLPIAISQLIAAIAAQDFERARTMVIFFVFGSAAVGILSPLTKYVALLGENTIYSHAMIDYFNNLLVKDVKYFNESMTGYITTASRQFSDNTLDLTRKMRDRYLGTLFSMTIPIVVISFVDLALGLLVLALSTVQAVYLLWASQKIAPYRTKAREKYRQTSGLISDAITNIVAIKSTAQEKALSKKVGVGMYEESQLFIARYKAQVRLIAFREVITVTFFLILFWVTVGRIDAGAVGVAGAILVITYATTILTAIYDLSDALDEHDDFIDKIVPAFELMEVENAITDPKRPLNLGKVKGEIAFKNVTFAYKEGDDKVPIFSNLDLLIPAGQKLGIVGLSGAGKSTLAKLILRFEDVQSGEISIDGMPVAKLKQSDLRRNIAYVPQEPLLFHSSIFENIRLADVEASEKAVKQAAELAHATQFINALPLKFESIVGERGVKLSGGQKQRIAIARAVLQNAPIIVLDEATSALDSESEQIVKDSFKDIFQNKTAIVIAHRLSTLADMDRIVLLHEGKILEDGTHQELLKKQGVYAKLWHRQRLHPEDLEIRDSNLAKLNT